MLTDQQISHFRTFGLLVLRGAFSGPETGAFVDAAEALFRRILGRRPREDEVIWEPEFVERSRRLIELIDDERIHDAARGPDRRPLSCGSVRRVCGVWTGTDRSITGIPTGMKSRVKLTSRRLKIMLYLDPLTREEGAIRVIPGSHRPPLFDTLLPFQEEHTRDHPRFFGLQGQDVPGCAVETAPGDLVILNPWIFHSVYGKVGRRRTVVLKFAGRPRTGGELRELTRSPGIFSPHRALLESGSPRIRRMFDGLAELEKRAAAV